MSLKLENEIIVRVKIPDEQLIRFLEEKDI